MKFSDVVSVRLVDFSRRSLPMALVYLDLDFFTRGNYRYGFRLGPTDEYGLCKINFNLVENRRIEASEVFLMDYNTALSDCDKRIKISIPSVKELQEAYNRVCSWYNGKIPDYAKGWHLANNGKVRAEDVFAELAEGETVVEIPCALVEKG